MCQVRSGDAHFIIACHNEVNVHSVVYSNPIINACDHASVYVPKPVGLLPNICRKVIGVDRVDDMQHPMFPV